MAPSDSLFWGVTRSRDTGQLPLYKLPHSVHTRNCWGGGEWWGGVMTFLTFAHMWDARQLRMMTFLALARVWDATQLMGWHDDVSCICTHVRCAHMWDATQLMGWGWWRSLRLLTCEMLRDWWVRDDDVNTCTHVGCLQLMGWGWWGSLHLHTCEILLIDWFGMMMFLAFAHMWDATQLIGWGWWRFNVLNPRIWDYVYQFV